MRVIKNDTQNVKNKTKKAPRGVNKDFATLQREAPKIPDMSPEAGAINPSRDKSAPMLPNIILALVNLDFIERSGRLVSIIKKGTKIMPTPKYAKNRVFNDSSRPVLEKIESINKKENAISERAMTVAIVFFSS